MLAVTAFRKVTSMPLCLRPRLPRFRHCSPACPVPQGCCNLIGCDGSNELSEQTWIFES